MGKLFGKKKSKAQENAEVEVKSFFDCICPATIKFFAHYYIVGDSYRCTWVIREYPPSTEEQAILSHLADHSGVTLRMYNRLVDLEPEETEYSPMIVHHPFTSSGFVGLRDEKGDVQIGNIWENADDRARWQGLLGQFINDSTDVFEIYSRIEKPYALAFLKYATPFLSQKDFSLILGDAWLRSEQPNHDPNLSQKKLLKMFSAADPTALMEDVERKRLAELDAVVTVYRGTHSDKPNSEQALSWTLNRDTTQWFANRYGKDGKVYEAKIEKKHIHALFLRREEAEVILDPKYLTEVVQVPKMEQAEEITMGGMKW